MYVFWLLSWRHYVELRALYVCVVHSHSMTVLGCWRTRIVRSVLLISPGNLQKSNKTIHDDLTILQKVSWICLCLPSLPAMMSWLCHDDVMMVSWWFDHSWCWIWSKNCKTLSRPPDTASLSTSLPLGRYSSICHLHVHVHVHVSLHVYVHIP